MRGTGCPRVRCTCSSSCSHSAPSAPSSSSHQGPGGGGGGACGGGNGSGESVTTCGRGAVGGGGNKNASWGGQCRPLPPRSSARSSTVGAARTLQSTATQPRISFLGGGKMCEVSFNHMHGVNTTHRARGVHMRSCTLIHYSLSTHTHTHHHHAPHQHASRIPPSDTLNLPPYTAAPSSPP